MANETLIQLFSERLGNGQDARIKISEIISIVGDEDNWLSEVRDAALQSLARVIDFDETTVTITRL